MRLFEHESKEILSERGISIPLGDVVSSHENVFLPSPSIWQGKFFNPAPKALLLVPYVVWDKVAVLKGN